MELVAGKRPGWLATPASMWPFVLLALLGLAPATFAQRIIDPGDGGSDGGGIAPWVEYRKQIEATQRISALDFGFSGEQVSLYNGATTFSVTDIDIPGNFDLPVRLARRISIELQPQDQIQPYDSLLHGVGNWEVEVPYMAATYPTSTGWNAQRCSQGSVPPISMGPNGAFHRSEVWQGITIHVPGRGDATALGLDAQVPIPSSGGPYRLTTTSRDAFDCIPMKSGLSGEGFRMTTTSGVRYYFDVGTARTASKLVKSIKAGRQFPFQVYLERNRYYLLVSKVTDRFDNWVQFQYNSAGHPTRIWSSDGREIDLTYNSDGRMVSATSHGRTWQYQYDADGNLVSVTLPDASRWQYAYTGSLTPPAPPPYDSLVLPWCQGTPAMVAEVFTLTATHPSGAIAAFRFDNTRHFRSGVHASECMASGNPADPDYDLLVPYYYDVMSLTQKTVSGPGLPTSTWSYDYGDIVQGLWGDHAESPNYPCTTCTQFRSVTVTNPGGTRTRYQFGMVYQLNDGRQLQADTLDANGNVVRSDTSDYLTDAAAATQPFYPQYGHVYGGVADPLTARIRPVTKSTITQDGATFTTTTNTFDIYARGIQQTESSSLGYSRVVQTTYYDNTSLWVLGQVAQSTVAGVIAAQTTYSSMAQPVQSLRFGKLVSTKAWNSDGTLHSVTDGNGRATIATNWKRGIPQSVGYADGTEQSAVVNDSGWITAITDENGLTTSYGYDAMGRLASIGYPTGDNVAWNPTLLSFAQVAGTEYGIPAGHWKQAVHTGNGYTVIYFDALWRPLVSERYDSGNKAATLSQVVHLYDEDGREVFTSYPTHAASAFTDSLPGTYTGYDALDRITSVSQDSELDPLLTVTAYLAGFKTKVTDPRGYVTVTGFQAFGKPDTSRPVSIVMPEGAATTITRDAFGKPLVVKRSGSYGGSTVSVTRTLVYDGNQLLCKRIEPESGATLFGYDAANNVVWSAPGTTLNQSVCDRDSVSPSQKVTRTYDQRNRLTSVAYPDGISDSQFTYADDGAMSSATNSNGGNTVRTDYSYDKRRLLTSETLTVPGAGTFLTGYAYDANGNLGSLSYPGGRSPVTFAPNALGQPTEASGYATGVLYFPNGGIKQFTYGDGSVHTLTQNLRGLPERSQDRRAGTAVLDNTLAYDQNGNVAAITDGFDNVGNIDMVYDGLDRLTSATSPMFAGNHQANFTYDPLNNLRSAGVGNGNQYDYSYDVANRLVAMSGSQGFDFGYDVRGNTTHRGAQYYSFDLANRLRAASGVESYLYDAAGRRVRKDNGVMTYFVYDKAGALLHEQGASGAGASDYIYLGGSLVAKVTKDAPPTVPDTPASITVPSSSSTGSFTVSWDSVTGATSYVLQQQFNGGSWSQQYNGSATSKAVSGLGNGSYVYRVQACNSAGCSGWRTSGTVTVTLPQAPPETPASITVPSSSSTGSFTVSWDSVTGATSYVLQQQFNGGSWTQQYNGSATSKAISGLTSGSYVYRVQACNSAGCSGWRTSGTVTVTLPQPPATPTSITVPSSSSTGSFTVSWSSVGGATSYVLQQQFNGGSWTQQYNGSATSKAISGLGNGSYAYRVQACNSAGCSGWRTSGTVTVLKVPPIPASISVPSSSSTGSFTVSWDSATGATSYVLQQQFNGGSWSQQYNGSATSKAISGLGNGSYAYRVQACNSAGCSGWRTSGTVTVLKVPPVPATLTVPSQAVAGQPFPVSWSASSGATSYTLKHTAVDKGTSNTAYSGPATSTTITIPGPRESTHAYNVQACNSAGCSGWSATKYVYITGPGGPQAAPAAAGSSGP